MANGKRLIDANALRMHFDDLPTFIGLTGGCVQQYIDQAPTVDAVEVVHGKWVKCNRRWKKTYKCSVCDNGAFDGNFVYGTRYCPVCGAKMDLET